MYRILYRLLVPGWSAKPLISAHERIMGTHTVLRASEVHHSTLRAGAPTREPVVLTVSGHLVAASSSGFTTGKYLQWSNSSSSPALAVPRSSAIAYRFTPVNPDGSPSLV